MDLGITKILGKLVYPLKYIWKLIQDFRYRNILEQARWVISKHHCYFNSIFFAYHYQIMIQIEYEYKRKFRDYALLAHLVTDMMGEVNRHQQGKWSVFG